MSAPHFERSIRAVWEAILPLQGSKGSHKNDLTHHLVFADTISPRWLDGRIHACGRYAHPDPCAIRAPQAGGSGPAAKGGVGACPYTPETSMGGIPRAHPLDSTAPRPSTSWIVPCIDLPLVHRIIDVRTLACHRLARELADAMGERSSAATKESRAVSLDPPRPPSCVSWPMCVSSGGGAPPSATSSATRPAQHLQHTQCAFLSVAFNAQCKRPAGHCVSHCSARSHALAAYSWGHRFGVVVRPVAARSLEAAPATHTMQLSVVSDAH